MAANALSSTLSDGDMIDTLSGDPITVSVSDLGVKINDASAVITPDIIASNGIIHVIDTVLLPPAFASPAETSTDLAGVPSPGSIYNIAAQSSYTRS